MPQPYIMLELHPFAWATGAFPKRRNTPHASARSRSGIHACCAGRDDFRTTALFGGALALFERPMEFLVEDFQAIR